MEPLIALLGAAAVSLAGGAIGEALPVLRRFLGRLLRIDLGTPTAEAGNYKERMLRLTDSLKATSSDFEQLLLEMQQSATNREAAVASLEEKLSDLSGREEVLQQRIAHLDSVQPEAAREFIRLMDQEQARGERRSARRDYTLFAVGVAVTVLLTLLFHAFGIG